MAGRGIGELRAVTYPLTRDTVLSEQEAADALGISLEKFRKAGFPTYQGGYADALSDVVLLLNGTIPNRRNYWRREDV